MLKPIFLLLHHILHEATLDLKSVPKATIWCWKALCLLPSTYQPAVEYICKVERNKSGFKSCISQNSLSLFIRFNAGKVKSIHIIEEAHCSLPVPINFFFCKAQDFSVEDEISIQITGWKGNCHISCTCNCSLKRFLTHLWLGSSIVQIERA